MKKYLLLTVLLLMIAACGKPKTDPNAEKAAEKKFVKTQIVKKEAISAQIIINGNFEPVNEAAQTALAAEVVKVYHKNGDRVKAGDLIIQLYDKNIEATYKTSKANFMAAQSDYNKTKTFSQAEELDKLESYKASMVQAKEALDKAKRGSKQDQLDIYQSNVTTAKKNYEQAKFNYEKYKNLYDDKLISEASYLQYETSYIQAKSSLESAEKNLKIAKDGTDVEDIRSLQASYDRAKSAYNLAQKNVNAKVWNNSITSSESNYEITKANYEVAKKNYDDLSVRAKISGIISDLTVKQYEKTTDATVLFTVLDDRTMEINVGLNASEITQINLNSKVQLTIQELGKTITGVITEISPSADTTTNKFMVKVSLANSDMTIKKGMYAKAIVYSVPKEMMVVPKESIVVKGLYKYVYVLNGDKVKQVKVETGNSTDKLQEIVSNEIKAGDKVVIEGQDLLEDSELVEEVK